MRAVGPSFRRDFRISAGPVAFKKPVKARASAMTSSRVVTLGNVPTAVSLLFMRCIGPHQERKHFAQANSAAVFGASEP